MGTANSEASGTAPVVEITERPKTDGKATVVVLKPSFEPSSPAPNLKPYVTTKKAATPTKATAATRKPRVASAKGKSGKKATPAQKPAKNQKGAKKAAKATEAAGPREGSKTAQVVALLQRKNGATLEEIMDKMGWQKHTVRGFMAGAMKKAGYTVESFKPEGGVRTYRINQ